MLYPGVLNRIPPALLSMLELKQRGANPDTLSDTVVPTIDLSHWYNASAPATLVGTYDLLTTEVYAASLLFNVSQVVVPQDELWWVREFTVGMFVDAADLTSYFLYQLAPLIILPELASGTAGPSVSFQGAIVGDSAPQVPFESTSPVPTIGFQITSPALRDLWVPPGAAFGAQFVGSIDAANNPQLVGWAVVDRFKI